MLYVYMRPVQVVLVTIESMWKGVAVASFEVLHRDVDLLRKPTTIRVIVVGVQAQMRIEHVPDINIQIYPTSSVHK
jgi:hypothetical protein